VCSLNTMPAGVRASSRSSFALGPVVCGRAAGGGLGHRLAARCGGGAAGGWRLGHGRGPAFGGSWGGGSVPVPVLGADSRAGFAACARTLFLRRPGGCGRPRSSAAAGPLGACARRGPRGGRSRPAGPRAHRVDERRPEKLLFQAPVVSGRARGAGRPLASPRAAALGIGWRRGHWRLGRAAALRAGGGLVGGGLVPGLRSRWSRLRRSLGRQRSAASGFRGWICGAREDGGGLQLFLRRPCGCGRPGSSAPAPSSAPAGTLGGARSPAARGGGGGPRA